MQHLTRCHTVEGCTATLRLSVQEIVSWMSDTYADQCLISMVEECLLAQGSKTTLECVPVCATVTWNSWPVLQTVSSGAASSRAG